MKKYSYFGNFWFKGVGKVASEISIGSFPHKSIEVFSSFLFSRWFSRLYFTSMFSTNVSWPPVDLSAMNLNKKNYLIYQKLISPSIDKQYTITLISFQLFYFYRYSIKRIVNLSKMIYSNQKQSAIFTVIT